MHVNKFVAHAMFEIGKEKKQTFSISNSSEQQVKIVVLGHGKSVLTLGLTGEKYGSNMEPLWSRRYMYRTTSSTNCELP